MSESKTCSKCLTSKPVDLFHRRGKGRASWCKSCKTSYDRKAYDTDTGQGVDRRKKLRERTAEERRYNKEFLWDYKATHPCVDCGEDDPIVLDFDHVRGKKIANVSKLASYSRKAILEELPKCEVRCANCHRRVTHQRRGIA